MKFAFEPISSMDAAEIAGWRYPSPYCLYNIEHTGHLLDPSLHYFVSRLNDRVTAFLCYGEDARVPGFPYDDSCVDVGGGLRPDLTGRGLGESFLRQAIGFVQSRTGDKPIRVSVVAFNERCQKVCRSVGLTCLERFVRPSDGAAFVVMTGDRLA